MDATAWTPYQQDHLTGGTGVAMIYPWHHLPDNGRTDPKDYTPEQWHDYRRMIARETNGYDWVCLDIERWHWSPESHMFLLSNAYRSAKTRRIGIWNLIHKHPEHHNALRNYVGWFPCGLYHSAWVRARFDELQERQPANAIIVPMVGNFHIEVGKGATRRTTWQEQEYVWDILEDGRPTYASIGLWSHHNPNPLTPTKSEANQYATRILDIVHGGVADPSF